MRFFVFFKKFILKLLNLLLLNLLVVDFGCGLVFGIFFFGGLIFFVGSIVVLSFMRVLLLKLLLLQFEEVLFFVGVVFGVILESFWVSGEFVGGFCEGDWFLLVLIVCDFCEDDFWVWILNDLLSLLLMVFNIFLIMIDLDCEVFVWVLSFVLFSFLSFCFLGQFWFRLSVFFKDCWLLGVILFWVG